MLYLLEFHLIVFVNIQKLSSLQKQNLCFEMAKLYVFQLTEGGFDEIFDPLDIEKPNTFDRESEEGDCIYQELEEVLTNKTSLEYRLLATCEPDEFMEISSDLLEKFIELPDDLSNDQINEFIDNASEEWF